MRTEMEMRIAGARDAGTLTDVQPADAAGAFAKELGRAIESVDQLQLAADKEANLVATGGGNLHEMSIALEKADLSMRLALKVRNKIVDAYNEVMRMSV